MNKYTLEEVKKATLEYFNGDELATNVWIEKYCLKDNEDNLLEKTPEDTLKRLTKEFDRIEKNKFKVPLTYDEIYNLLDGFKYLILAGSPMFGIGNKYQIVSLSNCFVVETPFDSYSSILKSDAQFANICKRRGGVGICLDNLRPAGSKTNNAARTSTGIIPFMERFSNTILECGQAGRRGASIQLISVHHPQILDFIKAKDNETKITGSNISVKLTDEFMKAVENNTDYELRFPVDGPNKKVISKISARMVWNEIIHHAWLRAEPGLLFWDNVHKYTPGDCYDRYKSVAANPCCFSIDQDIYVPTSNGLKEIKTITNNDLIYINETGEYVKTTGYFEQGIADIYRVTFSNGTYLDITNNHKLCTVKEKRIGSKIEYVEGELIELKYLNVGDKIAIHTTRINGYENTVNSESQKFTRIVDIKFLKRGKVGCIEVEKYHKFTANGIISGNSELTLCELDSCRLMSINLYSFVENPFTDKAKFNWNKFKDVVYKSQRLMDDLVDLESEKISLIINKIKQDPEPMHIKRDELEMWQKIKANNDDGRRGGLGILGLADMFAALGIGYGTEESIKFADKLFECLKLTAYRCSVDMAKELGAFKGYDPKLEENNPFIIRIKNVDPELYKDMVKYGRRNVGLLAIAPTGSISLVARKSSGIEPVFSLKYTRRRKLSDSDNTKPDFIDKEGIKWIHYNVLHPALEEWSRITGEKDITKSPWYNYTADKINWINRVKLQGVIQKHICHSISSCLTPDTLIETDKGLMYLDELCDFTDVEVDTFKPNNNIFDGHVLNENLEYDSITHFYNNGIKPVFRLRLINGLEIKATGNEKVIYFNEDTGLEEWREISLLNIGDKIKIK